jgi:hypothetical protein
MKEQLLVVGVVVVVVAAVAVAERTGSLRQAQE